MRFVPLIPLIILALGALIVETLLPSFEDQPSSKFFGEITNAKVTNSSEQMYTLFATPELRFEQNVITTQRVIGRLVMDSKEQFFTADSMKSGEKRGTILLEGNVKFVHTDAVLNAEKVWLENSGNITGSKVTAQFNGLKATANEFIVDGSSNLVLKGDVRTVLDL